MQVLGPHKPYPKCKWPRRSLITIVKPGQPIMVIKHWHGVPSTSKQSPASEGLALVVGNTSESPSECQQGDPVWH